ncbi:MAG: hypothetical protein HYS38_09230 [Acidobacteria bacterium]|nr:hypothetical protein [Acidobacteriota bacterium]
MVDVDTITAAAAKTLESLGYTLGAIFVGLFVGAIRLYKKRKEPGFKMSWDMLSAFIWPLLAVGYVFAFHLGATFVRVERQDEPPLRYSLGGSTNIYSYYPVPYDRWVPITEFRDVTLEWTREREATVEGMVSFSMIGQSSRCQLRLIDVISESTVAVTDWISRTEPQPFSERMDVPFRVAVPRGEGRMIYRLEITSDGPNGECIASAEIVFAFVRP